MKSPPEIQVAIDHFRENLVLPPDSGLASYWRGYAEGLAHARGVATERRTRHVCEQLARKYLCQMNGQTAMRAEDAIVGLWNFVESAIGRGFPLTTWNP